MTQRKSLKSTATHQSLSSTKKKIVERFSQQNNSCFMKLFQAGETVISEDEISDIQNSYFTLIAPNIKTADDLEVFLNIFVTENTRLKSLFDNIKLYTLIQCQHLYTNPQALLSIYHKLFQTRFSLIDKFNDIVATQTTFNFLSGSTHSENDHSDRYHLDVNTVFYQSLICLLQKRLKPFPTNIDFKRHTTGYISMLAQNNARIASDVLNSCATMIRLQLPFTAKLQLLQLLHGYDKAYIRACDQLQTAHDEGRYLSIRLLKCIDTTFTSQDQRNTALAEIPEMSRGFYANKISFMRLARKTNKPHRAAHSLRLYERGKPASNLKDNTLNNDGKKITFKI